MRFIKALPGLIITLTPFSLLAAGLSASAGSRPNILLILVDDLGYGDLSVQGAEDLRTPHIDSLADAGIRLDNFYANCPVCSPTRAALLTGRYQDLVGVPGVVRTFRRDNWGNLADDAVLLPSVLKRVGYQTAIIGKWHLGLTSPDIPNDRGFDFFHGFLGDMMDDYYNHRRHGFNYMRLNQSQIDPEGHATDLFSRWAVDYIKRVSSTGRPFFLYLSYNAPHTPIQPPEDWLEKVRNREGGIDPKRARLTALIEHLDSGIGTVLEGLKTSGLAENTLVIFTSDNGGQINVGANNGALRGGKQDMWEGGIRVPFMAVWPGKIPAATLSQTVGMSMDLFPLICEAAGVELDFPINGQSLLPALLGKAGPEEDRPLVWVRREGGRRYGGRSYYAVRQGRWKLAQNSPYEPMRLFDLLNDPLESQPLPADHEKAIELEKYLRSHINQSGTVPWQRQ